MHARLNTRRGAVELPQCARLNEQLRATASFKIRSLYTDITISRQRRENVIEKTESLLSPILPPPPPSLSLSLVPSYVKILHGILLGINEVFSIHAVDEGEVLTTIRPLASFPANLFARGKIRWKNPRSLRNAAFSKAAGHLVNPGALVIPHR